MIKSFAYRIGTHAAFKAAMLAAIAKSAHPALQGLRTRSDEDFSIALCDAVAVLADNLSFYQERLASHASSGGMMVPDSCRLRPRNSAITSSPRRTVTS